MRMLHISLLLMISQIASAELVEVANMEKLNITDWNHEQFNGSTDYRMVIFEGARVLQADSQGGASGLFRKQRIDLSKTPYLNWRWRIEQPLTGLDEQSKAGDDYAARIYVVVSGGMLFWRTKALSYVWSSNQAAGTQWDNAYASQAKMLAVEMGASKAGQWQTYKRNVADDMRSAFDDEVTYIDVIAIMTDTDDSKGAAKALYGDIYFSSE